MTTGSIIIVGVGGVGGDGEDGDGGELSRNHEVEEEVERDD